MSYQTPRKRFHAGFAAYTGEPVQDQWDEDYKLGWLSAEKDAIEEKEKRDREEEIYSGDLWNVINELVINEDLRIILHRLAAGETYNE